MNSKKPVFLKSLSGLAVAMALAIFIFYRADKSKPDFEKVTGEIIALSKLKETLPRQDTLKFRYLQIDNYPKEFQIFIGKDAGDFKPKFEKIDSLKKGDIITIYFDDNFKSEHDQINRLAYFIDRGQETIFIKGDWEKMMAYFFIGFVLLIFVLLLVLKQKGKIE